MSTRVDRFSLIAGLIVTALGIVLMFDQSAELDLSGGVLAAIFAAAFGLIMLVSGLLEDR